MWADLQCALETFSFNAARVGGTLSESGFFEIERERESICHLRSANIVTLEGTVFLQYKLKTNFSNLVKSASLGDLSFPNLSKASETLGERESVCQHDYLK